MKGRNFTPPPTEAGGADDFAGIAQRVEKGYNQRLYRILTVRASAVHGFETRIRFE
ncbi:MAG: hypothetical protein WBG17_13190 [Burkholderiaceae bacterium]